MAPALTQAEKAPQPLELGTPFLDNMILQRGVDLPVWGWAEPGTEVTVAFAGQSRSAKAGEKGKWSLELAPLQASSEERAFTVTAASGEQLRLQGVLVGEVWLASGQSNMVWIARKSRCRDLSDGLAKAEKDIPIRELSIDTVSALYPQERGRSERGWKKPEHAMGFSALALAFTHDLYKELNVPVGILLCAQSNTRIEAFTQREAIEAHPKLKVDADLMHDADPLTAQGKAAYEQYYRDLAAWQKEAAALSKAGGKIPQRPELPGIASMWRGPSQFFNGQIHPVIPYAVRGAIWNQGTSNSKDGKIYAARMEALVRGWRDAWDMPDMPFYFTQMQPYGSTGPDNLGFADIRQVQHHFFINNRENVGMVVQSDHNSARPSGIHYSEKLHPGMRLARWALAHQYGRDIAYTGPIYSGYAVKDDRVIVSFEKDSLFGGLMVGSKGHSADLENYVEPARPTPGEALNHFRLCGEDGEWHAAEAQIVGDTVVVRSDAVPAPVGVQYAYNAVPEGSNLYNRAGLPATPFAAVEGELIFQEPQRQIHTAPPAERRPFLHLAEHFRHGVVLQREREIPVWGHANPGTEVSVTLGGVTKTTRANELDQWSVRMPAMPASTEPLTLQIETDHDRSRRVGDILVGDVWFVTGGGHLTSELAYNLREKDAERPASQALLREFRRKTKASTNPTPRKRDFEKGGGRFRSSWETADFSKDGTEITMFAYHFAKALGRENVPQGFMTMSSGRGGRNLQLASPLSWTSYAGVKEVEKTAFRARLADLLLQYPDTKVAREALAAHLAEVKRFVQTITDAAAQGKALSTVPKRAPSFPPDGFGKVRKDTTPTLSYNWCVSPFTPMAVSGVIWVPSEQSIGENSADYAAELEIYAASLPLTFGQAEVPFYYAQPEASLVEGIRSPRLPEAQSIGFDSWPKSLAELATRLGERAAQN